MPTRLMPSSIPGPTLTVHPGLRPAPPPPLTSQDRSWPATPFAPAFFASDRHPAGPSRAPARLGRSAAEMERGPARARHPPKKESDGEGKGAIERLTIGGGRKVKKKNKK